jgi:pimeloyl-ACP methyl ester carboxylesterase
MRRLMAGAVADYLAGDGTVPPAALDELRHHDPAAIVEADQSLERFDARAWLGELGCPAVSIVTEQDAIVPRDRQIELAHALDAAIIPLPADHDVALTAPDHFLPALSAACHRVAMLTERRAIEGAG